MMNPETASGETADLSLESDEPLSHHSNGGSVRSKVGKDLRDDYKYMRNGDRNGDFELATSNHITSMNGELSNLQRDLDVGSEHGSHVSHRSNDSRGSKHSLHSRSGALNSVGLPSNYPSLTSDHELSEIFRTAGRGNYKNDGSSQGTITPGASDMGSINSIPSSTHSSNHQNSLDLDVALKPREYRRFGGGDSQSEIVRMRRDDLKLQHSRSRPVSLPDPSNYKDFLTEGFNREDMQRQAPQPLSVKTPLMTSRASSMSISSRNSSHNSSRASLVLPNGGIEAESAKGDEKKLKEMEEMVESLKALLKEKERNIKVLEDDLQDVQKTNETLLREREEVVRASKQMNEKQLDDHLRDKETLTTEIVLLKQQLSDKAQTGQEMSSPHSLEFNPDHPKVLQKRIADLESQLSDLQEANECAEAQLQNADKDLEKYKEENASLKMVNALGVEDLTAENDKLKRLVAELKEYKRHRGHNRVFEDEVSRLRADTRVLRETNHKLEEENIKLREDFLDLQRNHENVKMLVKQERRRKKSPTNYKSNQNKVEEYERQRLLDDLKVAQEKVNNVVNDQSIQPRIKDTDYLSPNVNSSRHYSAGDGRGLGSQLLPSKFSTAELTGKSPKSPQYAWLDAFDEKHLSPSSDMSDSTAILTAGWQAHAGLADHYLTEPTTQEISRSSRSRHRESRKSHDADDLSTSDSTSVTGMFEQKSNGTSKYHRRNLSSDSSTSSFLGDALNYKSFTDPRIRSRSFDRTARSKQSRGDMVTVSHHTLQDKNNYNASDLTATHNARRNRLRSVSPPRSQSPPGFRSVSPRAVATQHNKGTISDQISKGYVLPLRPFAPRTPRDIEVGMKVKFSRPNGRVSQGMVKYVGQLPGRHDSYLGVELDTEEGRHDGTYNGERFFKCRANRGVFVSFKKVILVWA
ncbi:intracellular protein transport protein USO1-like isoform X2 [Anneissia japonica]|nr:intracellular protein transport protein USO1-like isoform X2 [Anneissia japonica]